MIRVHRLVLAVCLWCCIQIHPAFACRYNVRETGFVDLGLEPYILYSFIDANTPPDFTAAFKEIAQDTLAESNLRVQIIDADRQKDHPAIKLLDPNDASFPCAVLVSPDGQSLPVSVTKPDKPFKKTVRSAIDEILVSPKRKEILLRVSKAYGIVLLLEGPDAGENEKAQKAASVAVEQVVSQMDYMPKPIAHPPELVVMDANSVANERVLLWSLGLEPNDVNEPVAIVIYGRARWIGPLFKGDEINEDDLASVLFVIGADCECGFDYRWLQGTMLPAKWDQKIHARAVKSLGFDPESPMIKMEISRIIGRGMGGYAYQGTPFGYQELIIEPETDLQDLNDIQAPDEPNDPSPEPNAVEVALQDPPEPNALAPAAHDPPEPNVTASLHQVPLEPNTAKPVSDSATIPGTYAPLRSAAILTIALFALVVIIGIAILARSRRV